jgi:hypothetical protein
LNLKSVLEHTKSDKYVDMGVACNPI